MVRKKKTDPAAELWRSRVIEHGDANPSTLKANARNWREHGPRQREAMRELLDDVGWVGEVMVNRTTGNVVDGHLRVELAIERSEPTVPVRWVELSEAEEAIVLATFDPLGAMADASAERLSALLESTRTESDKMREVLAAIGKANGVPPEAANAPATSRGLGNTIYRYEVVFDSEEQQQRFYAWLRGLKKKWPEESIGSRVVRAIEQGDGAT